MYSKMSCIWFLYLSFQLIVICLNTITFASTVPQRASNLPEIKNFTEFLENSLHRKVLNYEISPLSTSNYHTGASIHKVDVHLAANSESPKGDVFNFVIKTWATDPFLIELGNLSHAFLAEERFYLSIIPAIESFEQMSNVPKTKRIDTFIKSFGSRISLKPNATQSDADALILLENIVHENFVHIDERIGFDREETLAVIKSVAKFNALCIAMKRLQPTLFNSQIKPYIEGGTHKQNTSANIVGIGDGLSLIKNLNAELRMKVENQFRMIDTQKQIADLTDTPYKAIHLQDLKKFNIMIRKREGEPVKVKIYDFNFYSYQSFVMNLVVFLFTSVRWDVLTTNFKFFIDTHHSEFIKTLELVNCPLDDYTHDKLWAEVRDKAKIQLLYLLYHTKRDMVFPNIDAVSQTIPSEKTLDAWKCIINIFEENGMI